VSQKSVPVVDEKRESAVLPERRHKAQPVKVIFDDGHEEFVSTYAEHQVPKEEIEQQQQRRDRLPRYSEVMKA
jgi:hypothetical protein